MSLSSPESSGDASLPGDTLVAILSRNLEAQQQLSPTLTDQQRRGACLLITANMIAEIMFRLKFFWGG